MKITKNFLKISVVLLLALILVIGATSCGMGASTAPKDAEGEIEDTDIKWEYNADDNELIISGEGAIPDFVVDNEEESEDEENPDVPWKACRTSVQKITIEEGITQIGVRAFAFCPVLTEVTIPSTVVLIEDSAFEACASLTSIAIPENVTSIGERAFAHCTKLSDVVIAGEISEIKSWTFKGCGDLDTLIIDHPEGKEIAVADDAFLESAFEEEKLDSEGVKLIEDVSLWKIEVKYFFEGDENPFDSDNLSKYTGERYEFELPQKEGYKADTDKIEGEAKENINMTVTYTKIVEEETEDTSEVEATEEPEEDKKIGAGTIIAIIVFALTIIALVVFAIFTFRSGKNDKNGKGGSSKKNEKSGKKENKKK